MSDSKQITNKPGQSNKNRNQDGHQRNHDQKPSGSKSSPLEVPPESQLPYIDTHCHFDIIFERDHFKGDLKKYMTKSNFPGNFEGAISIFCDPAAYSSFGIWRELLEEQNIYASFGIHPHNAKYYNDSIEAKIVEAIAHPKAVAWGECGLDYHYDNSPRDVQRNIFRRQILKAVEVGKPLVLHSREAEKDTFDIMNEVMPKNWKVHCHCHSGSEEFTLKMMETFPNLKFGFTGNITFPGAKQQDLIKDIIPLDRILLETDGPYMCPERGKTAHPGHIPYIAHKISRLKNCSIDEVYKAARENTRAIYGI